MTETKIRISAIDATQAAFRSVQDNVGKLKGALSGVGGQLAAAFSVAAIAAFTKSLVDAANELQDVADRTGVAAVELSRLGVAAKLNASSQEEVNDAVQKLSKSIAEASTGAGAQADAFAALGISVRDVNGNIKPTLDIFNEIANAFNRAEDGAVKVAIAQDLLGRSGSNLIPLLNQGAGSLSNYNAQFSDEFIQQSAKFNENLDKLNIRFKTLAATILGPVVEALNKFFDFFEEKEQKKVEKGIKNTFEQPAIFANRLRNSVVKDFKDINEAVNLLKPKQTLKMPVKPGATAKSGEDPITAQLKEQNQQFIENLRLLGLLDTAEITRDNKLRALNALTKDGLITKKQELDILFQIESGYSDATEAIAKYSEATEVLNQNTQDLNDNMRFFAITLQDVGVTTMYSLEDAIFNVVTGTKSLKEAFKDMARAVISDLIRMYIRMKITIPLFNAFFGTTGTPAPIDTISIPPGRAMGGPVTGGRPYMVGEKGPELFVPERSGTIVPNNSMGGVVVNQTINVTTGVQQTVRTEIAALLPQISSAAKAAVLDAKQRGGAFSAAF